MVGMWRKRIPGTLLVGALLTLNLVGNNRLTDGSEICVQTWKVLMKGSCGELLQMALQPWTPYDRQLMVQVSG